MPAAAAEYFNLRTFGGGLLVRWDRREFGSPQPPDLVPPTTTWERSEAVSLAALYPPQSAAERAGFRLDRDSVFIGSIAEVRRHVAIAFPFWAAAAVFGVLPGAWVLRRQASRRRVRAGMCGACGYDLRATPDRCPECGTLASRPLS
jgi:hypothetical protein